MTAHGAAGGNICGGEHAWELTGCLHASGWWALVRAILNVMRKVSASCCGGVVARALASETDAFRMFLRLLLRGF